VKSTISTDASTKIKTLQGEFGKLEKEFDRSVDVTALKLAKKNGELRHYINENSQMTSILQRNPDYLTD
jgi:hypothetical protein